MSSGIYTLWGDHRSGNCFKAALILRLTGQPFEWREVSVTSGETRTAAFLARNPNGRVPLLRLHNGVYLAESNAILLHLAEPSDYLPVDAIARALVYQWLFFEQYSHEPYIAVARFLLNYKHTRVFTEQTISELHDKGDQALAVMETTLRDAPFLAGMEFTIADIALFAYTHVAQDGGFELTKFPAVCAWLNRVRQQPGVIDMCDFQP